MATTTPALSPHASSSLTDDQRRELLRQMIRGRSVDDEAAQLARMGHLDLWVASQGQEAAQAAAALALAETMIVPSFREHCMALASGISPNELLSLFAGRSFGGWNPLTYGFFPYTLSLASQCHHAIGYAIARRMQGQAAEGSEAPIEPVTLCIGDGATSEGDFNEALNLAAIEKAPVVIVVFNNGWALSKPTDEQMAAPLTSRAAGFGIPAVSVDGLDPEQTYAACACALDHVLAGRGPALVEAHVLRLLGHGSSDDQTRYRSAEQIREVISLDPVPAYRKRLADAGVVDDAWLAALDADVAAMRAEIAKEFSK